MHEKILLADDDELIVDVLRDQLQDEGFTVIVAYNGEDALTLALKDDPDLILLDVMMPQRQGWEVCREIRQYKTTPILMLTARGEEIDRVLGLELGADDYVVKPFSFRELLARIRANLRRAGYQGPSPKAPVSSDLTQLSTLTINRDRRTVMRHDQLLPLSQREYDLLLAFLDADGAVMKRGELLDQVWGKEWIGDPRTLDVHVRWLREKIEDDPSNPTLLLTVRGVGYRMVGQDEL